MEISDTRRRQQWLRLVLEWNQSGLGYRRKPYKANNYSPNDIFVCVLLAHERIGWHMCAHSYGIEEYIRNRCNIFGTVYGPKNRYATKFLNTKLSHLVGHKMAVYSLCLDCCNDVDDSEVRGQLWRTQEHTPNDHLAKSSARKYVFMSNEASSDMVIFINRIRMRISLADVGSCFGCACFRVPVACSPVSAASVPTNSALCSVCVHTELINVAQIKSWLFVWEPLFTCSVFLEEFPPAQCKQLPGTYHIILITQHILNLYII